MGADFLVLIIQVIGGIVGGCMASQLFRASDTGPFVTAILGALGGVSGAGFVAAASPGLAILPGLSGPLFAAMLAGGLSAGLGGLAFNALRRRA
jgi:hypothetical protein